jgi:hypothetical protein
MYDHVIIIKNQFDTSMNTCWIMIENAFDPFKT